MNFDEWWHKQMPNLVSGEEVTDRAIALAAWVAATEAERERCAVLCEEGVQNAPDWDSSQWDQACQNRAMAIRAS